jgi:hypothetical protein
MTRRNHRSIMTALEKMQEKKRRCGETFAETQRPILSYQKKMISSL